MAAARTAPPAEALTRAASRRFLRQGRPRNRFDGPRGPARLPIRAYPLWLGAGAQVAARSGACRTSPRRRRETPCWRMGLGPPHTSLLYRGAFRSANHRLYVALHYIQRGG